MVWQDLDDQTQRPQIDMWKFSFTVTATAANAGGDPWSMGEGVLIWNILWAWWNGTPWVIITYAPKSESRYEPSEAMFELWSCRCRYRRGCRRHKH
jgi:hypothetical protein